jgi:hypothetical protein
MPTVLSFQPNIHDIYIQILIKVKNNKFVLKEKYSRSVNYLFYIIKKI